MVKGMMLATLLALSACSVFSATEQKPAPIADPKAIWCAENRPQRPSFAEVDLMDRQRLEAVVAYNRKGAAWCGWKEG